MRPFAACGGVSLGCLAFLLQVRFVQTVHGRQGILTDWQVRDDWDLAQEPAKNATHNLVFDTVGSFLQHWPNTRYRNGHNIVPGVLPIGTLLYHGTYKNQVPKVPEWTATDPEHSYLFCRSLDSQDSGCWQLTLVATRPLNVLYFDGSSAAKMSGGPMHSQDLVVWRSVRPECTWNETKRIGDLCEWGKRHGLDGFLRMEMDFEIMLCDFTAGVKPVSFLNLAAVNRPAHPKPQSGPSDYPRLPSPPPTMNAAPPLRPPPSPRGIAPLFRVLESGSWHNNYPGEPRVQLDYSRMISFYDTKMFPSLQVARAGKERLDHTLEGISPSDVLNLHLHLDEFLRSDRSITASGINWASLVNQIVQRYAERLELLHYILNSTTPASEGEAEVALKQAHRHLTSMLTPYILHSAVPPTDDPVSKVTHSWAAPIFKHCATTHTNHLETISNELTYSEKIILQAVQGVSREICRALVTTWAEGMDTDTMELDLIEKSSLQDLLGTWKLRVEDLMVWLDWSYWRTCRPACGYEEMCYLPTWPFFGKGRLPLPRGPRGSSKTPSRFLTWVQETLSFVVGNTLDDPPGEWVDPQPLCIRRVEPLTFAKVT